MRKYMSAITFTAVTGILALGILLGGMAGKVNAAPKNRAVPGPAIYKPASVLGNDFFRVAVFNNDPILTVEYLIQFVDVINGSIIFEKNTDPVQPLSGVVEDHDPHNVENPTFIIIRGLVDPDGDGVRKDHPVSLSSVEIINLTTNITRHVPFWDGRATGWD